VDDDSDNNPGAYRVEGRNNSGAPADSEALYDDNSSAQHDIEKGEASNVSTPDLPWGNVAATEKEEETRPSSSPPCHTNAENVAGDEEENGEQVATLPLYLQIEHARQEQIREEQEKKQRRWWMCCALQGCLLFISCLGLVVIMSLAYRCEDQFYEELDSDDEFSEKGCKSVVAIFIIAFAGPWVLCIFADLYYCCLYCCLANRLASSLPPPEINENDT
jgi:hypothetical protein